MAKAMPWAIPDAEARKRGEQTGLDTLVVHAVNMNTSRSGYFGLSCVAKALSVPPGEYGRKVKTQRN